MKRRFSDSWKQKVHALFVDGAEVYRDAAKALDALGPHPPAEKAADINARFQQQLEKVRTRHADAQLPSATADPLDIILVDARSSWPSPQREMDQNFLEMLYWNRYREPLWIACQRMEAGDIDAYRRIVRVGEDYQRRLFGRGTINPAKGDSDHFALLGLGLDLGLNELSPEELADCFDAVCPCSKVHDADSLKKQRLRFRKAVHKAEEWLQNERVRISSREWMFVVGKNELWAKAVSWIRGKPPRVYIGELGRPASCYINEKGDLGVLEGSKLPAVLLWNNCPMRLE